jgi:hypothetical protein
LYLGFFEFVHNAKRRGKAQPFQGAENHSRFNLKTLW